MQHCRIGISIGDEMFLSNGEIDVINYKIDIRELEDIMFHRTDARIFLCKTGKTIEHG
jgi:hypothetical protein